MSASLTSGLAELLDSRADTRDMLSSSPNLAHACLLLGRGEIDLARRELALGLRDGLDGSQIIGQCIAAELMRMEGDSDGAWLAAVACATENRYNSIAVMYLKMLFPFAKARDLSSIAPSNTLTAQPEPEVQAEEAAIEPQIAIDQPLELAPAPENAPLPLSGTFPEGWERVLKEDCLAALRLDQKGEIANHGADLSGLIPLLHWLEKDLFSRTQMGQLHHAAFDGSARMLHHWGRGGDHLTALVDAGPQAAVLAARLGKAFHDLAENDA